MDREIRYSILHKVRQICVLEGASHSSVANIIESVVFEEYQRRLSLLQVSRVRVSNKTSHPYSPDRTGSELYYIDDTTVQ